MINLQNLLGIISIIDIKIYKGDCNPTIWDSDFLNNQIFPFTLNYRERKKEGILLLEGDCWRY